jgi:cell division septum initiation protein DivIVA
MIGELLRRFCRLLWVLVTRRELRRTARLRARFQGEQSRMLGTITDLERQLRQHSADSTWEVERLTGQIAILTEQLSLYADIVQRERQRVAAETAGLSRKESEAKFGGQSAGTMILNAGE